MTTDLRARIRAALAAELFASEALYCGRDWTAWAIGTMTEDDFSRFTDDDDRTDAVTDAVMAEVAPLLTAVTGLAGLLRRDAEKLRAEYETDAAAGVDLAASKLDDIIRQHTGE
jgi:hypothetical protein